MQSNFSRYFHKCQQTERCYYLLLGSAGTQLLVTLAIKVILSLCVCAMCEPTKHVRQSLASRSYLLQCFPLQKVSYVIHAKRWRSSGPRHDHCTHLLLLLLMNVHSPSFSVACLYSSPAFFAAPSLSLSPRVLLAATYFFPFVLFTVIELGDSKELGHSGNCFSFVAVLTNLQYYLCASYEVFMGKNDFLCSLLLRQIVERTHCTHTHKNTHKHTHTHTHTHTHSHSHSHSHTP